MAVSSILQVFQECLFHSGCFCDLPLPFGLGVTYTYINQNTKVYDVKVEGNPIDLTILDSKTSSNTVVFRADAWLLPFFNVYGLFGYTSGTTKPKIQISNGTTISKTVRHMP